MMNGYSKQATTGKSIETIEVALFRNTSPKTKDGTHISKVHVIRGNNRNIWFL